MQVCIYVYVCTCRYVLVRTVCQTFLDNSASGCLDKICVLGDVWVK